MYFISQIKRSLDGIDGKRYKGCSLHAGFLQAALLNHSHSVLVTCTSKYPPPVFHGANQFMQYTFAQLQILTCVSPPRSFSPSSSLPPPRWQKMDQDTTDATRTAEVIPPSSTFVPFHIFSAPSNGLPHPLIVVERSPSSAARTTTK